MQTAVMPNEWLIQLEQAASNLDENSMTELLQRLPDEYTFLAQALQNKVNNFDFDEIVDLLQQTIRLNK
ncbi:hypothetical protein H1P_820001 [Hyella patelloides LEGE 07179]|uniref:Uncharacterized protein n=1 Tax=Hyella patelloides LEGE 07179 TaxID=945734 RepID=A0A563W4G3_9CYAN|nr:hypothetical protein [Hyella patelloides]VEP18574.1 hypothetical protein H1P_820001 [Hyella patelloides LEGE 07179]